MDASAHKLHTIGVADNAGDTPASVRATVSTAEQRALNQLFGLDLPTTTNPDVGRLISQGIFRVVRNVYTSMNQAGLQALITDNVNAALREASPAGPLALNDVRRMHAVAKAAYESIPSDLLDRFALVALPARISMEDREATGVVEVRDLTFLTVGGPYTFRINTDLPFWKLDDNQPAGVFAITESIEGRTPQEIGIIGGPWALTHSFTNAEAAIIAAANDVRLTEKPEGTGTCEYEYGPVGVPNRPKLNVNVDKMLTESTTADAPSGLQNRPIFTLTADQIQLILEHRGKDGSFPYWKKYVTGLGNPNDGVQHLVCNYPGITPPVTIAAGVDVRGSVVVSEIVRIVHRQGTRTDIIGNRRVTLEQAQRDVHQKIESNRALLERLRTGTENGHGAIIAASMALNDRSILSIVTTSDGEVKLKKEMSDSQKKMLILQSLQKLRDLQVTFKLPTLHVPHPGAGTVATTLAGLDLESTRIQADIGLVSSGGIANNSGCANSIGIATAAVTAANKSSVTNQLQSYQRQVGEDIAAYEKMVALLQIITRDAADVDLYSKSATLRRYITVPAGTTVARTEFSPTTLPVNLSEDIKKEMAIEPEADLKSKIETAEASLKKSKAGGETGDTLQQKIFEEHFKRQGLSAAEAQKSANYMYARSFVDHELNGQIRALEEDLFEEHPETGFRGYAERRRERGKPTRVLYDFTRAVDLPRRNVGFLNNVYDWQRLSYPKLVTSYFGLKKLYEGGGPEYINCAGSSLLKRHMRDIARTLAQRHVPMLLSDFGNDLSDADRAKLQSRKTLSVETLEQFLTGDAPEKYSTRIEHVLRLTDKRTDWKRRGAKNIAVSTKNSVGSLAGYTGTKVIGAAKYTKNSVKLAKDVTWKNRKNIATFALFTALGGPMGMAAWGIYKSLESGSSKTSSAS